MKFGLKIVDSIKKKYNILFAISSLNLGGTEVQFIELVKNINKKIFNVGVVLMNKGSLDQKILEVKDITIFLLEKKSRYDIKSYFKYIKIINEFKTDLIYSFLPGLNIISQICKSFSSAKIKLIWGIRGGTKNLKKYTYFERFAFEIQKYMSRFIELAIFNSYQSKYEYKIYGYKFLDSFVIPNGFDVKKFKPAIYKRRKFRTKYKIKNKDIVIGINSRFEHIKGYDILVNAISKILKNNNSVYFFSIGYGDPNIIDYCKNYLKKFNSRVFWLGKVNNPQDIIVGWDIYCSPSRGEGFSNSLAESMLCQVVPIASDVGDSPIIVSDCGLIFKSEDTDDLYFKIKTLLNKKKLLKLKEKCRDNISKKFKMDNMINSTEKQFLLILNR